MKQKRRKKKIGVEARGKRSTRLKMNKANGKSLRRVKAWSRYVKCVKIWNGGSIDRIGLSESVGEIVNGRCARRSNG